MNSNTEKNNAAGSGTAKKGRRRRSVLREQRRAIIILIVAVAVLAVALPLVIRYIVNINVFTDVDGEKYYVVKVAGKYALCSDKQGTLLEQTKDGDYVTAIASTIVKVNEDTGDYEIVAVVDTEEGESLGTSN
ncbi:MAG: hypothetical protein K5647_02800, partial [Clostridiales bacterium]|nr:hypothetical protein [Clostridiales bacterium]